MPKASSQSEVFSPFSNGPVRLCCDPKWQTEPTSLCSCTLLPPASPLGCPAVPADLSARNTHLGASGVSTPVACRAFFLPVYLAKCCSSLLASCCNKHTPNPQNSHHCYWFKTHCAHCTKCQWIVRRAVSARKKNCIWKGSRHRRWQTKVRENHLTLVRIQDSFTLKGGLFYTTKSWCQNPLCLQVST